MFHDLLVIMGFAALMGAVLGWELDALFLTAVLTVVGFSLQDTIVVFDRIWENLNDRRNRKISFEGIVNKSVGDVFKRSVITQLSAMFIMVSILLFGGDPIKPFIAVLFVGLLSGTYSSIFTATPFARNMGGNGKSANPGRLNEEMGRVRLCHIPRLLTAADREQEDG
ncbi:MAG: hypothetical protein M5U34_17790 [Chloroflexi bacterium]|nr:hypothetical protein [Chloroflexota bacterium]